MAPRAPLTEEQYGSTFPSAVPLSVSSARATQRRRGTVAMIIRHITAGPVAVNFFSVGVTPGPTPGLIGEQDPAFPVPFAGSWLDHPRPARPSGHGAMAGQDPAVAAAQLHYRCCPVVPGIGHRRCLGQGSSSPACPHKRERIAGELGLPRGQTLTPPPLLQSRPEPTAGRTRAADRGTPAPAHPAGRNAPTRSFRAGTPLPCAACSPGCGSSPSTATKGRVRGG